MAVKASANITLTSVVDIKATYRYYLLQSSTLAKPSKPTTNPPSSSWSDSEPSYVNGSTNSLYYVDLTVFSDDSYAYSEVSLSTAYEAAKLAYNKAESANQTATEAKDKIDNLEVGGRNLLRYTQRLPVVQYITDPGIKPFSSGTLETTADGVKYTYSGSSTDGIRIPLAYEGCVDSGETVTLSFDYRGTISRPGVFYFLQKTSPNASVSLNDKVTIVPSETEWQHCCVTFSCASANDRICQAVLILYSGGGATGAYFENGVWVEIKAESLKLERGAVATDWTPAPEDVDGKIDSASEAASDAKNAADNNTVRLNDALLDIDAINATLKTLVTGQNGESLMTQTDTGWTFSIADMQNLLTKLSTNVDGLNSGMTDASSRLDNLDQSIEDLGEYTDYIKFGVDNGKPCIILGEVDSNFKVVITNTDIRFMEGSSVPASISNQALNIETAVINGELQQGNFAWVARSNGHYSLMVKG